VTIRHVVFDADDVLQQVAGGWHACAEPYLGERAGEFLQEAFNREAGWMVRRSDRLIWLEESLRRFGATASAEEVYAAVWLNIAVVPASLELVHRAHAAGYGVHLGTNQDEQRGLYMRQSLGYDAVFDVSCYSYELGVAKPDAGFFLETVRRIGAPAHDIVFVDDIEANVVGARAAGLAAIQWTVEEGHDVLVCRLASHGVVIDPY
jgi:putative hydrolase of the HAD superfamily